MSGLIKRITITLAILAIPLVVGLLFTYQIIHIDWISFMEIQPSFRPMEDPLPFPPQSVPIQGAAYVPGAGSPANPIPSDQASLERGKYLFGINCVLCHGEQGKGDGSISEDLIRKPADLTGINTTQLSDGEYFQVITNGVQPGGGRKGGMPDLRENLSLNDRWDVVNYLRSLQGKPQVSTGGIAPPAPGSCPIRAVDLIGAWVTAGVPETNPFLFIDINGKQCQGTFESDILQLFSQANLWYSGAPSCRTCHGPDVQISYARMDLSSYQGILAGSSRDSADKKGEDILGGGNWEGSILYEVLTKGEMPPDQPSGVNLQGPLIYAGGSK